MSNNKQIIVNVGIFVFIVVLITVIMIFINYMSKDFENFIVPSVPPLFKFDAANTSNVSFNSSPTVQTDNATNFKYINLFGVF